MSDHDPLCKWYGATDEPPDGGWCDCGLIDRTRVDERERIAQAIEVVAAPYRKPPYPNKEQSIAYRNAARIARNGGSDERA